jgi:hypothetical protein
VIWAILALLGVPLWLCAIAILLLVFRNRGLRKRAADIPMRLRLDANGRWRRGHGLWIHDVLGFRGSPAAWDEALLWAADGAPRELTSEEAHKFRRLDQPAPAGDFRPILRMYQPGPSVLDGTYPLPPIRRTD